MMISNIASGIISMEFGLMGPNMAIVTACATSNHNIGEAWRIIKFGDADGFICGGAEATILPMGLCGFANMKALSTRNDEPERASRPFDKDRDGFVMGEGAGVIVIEELEHAKKRGAKIYAELIGYGVSADAYHLSAPSPDGSGPAYAIQMALHHGKKNPQDVDYLNAHATSTGLGDIAETKAIKLAFGDHVKNGLMVSSTKSMTGHMLGAAGGMELIASVMAIKDGIVPPTINVEDQDPECDLDCVPNVAREVPMSRSPSATASASAATTPRCSSASSSKRWKPRSTATPARSRSATPMPAAGCTSPTSSATSRQPSTRFCSSRGMLVFDRCAGRLAAGQGVLRLQAAACSPATASKCGSPISRVGASSVTWDFEVLTASGELAAFGSITTVRVNHEGRPQLITDAGARRLGAPL